jgi:hypothetical protein
MYSPCSSSQPNFHIKWPSHKFSIHHCKLEVVISVRRRGEFDDPDIELPVHFTIDGLAASLIKSSTPLTGNMPLAYPSASTTTFAASPSDTYPFTFGANYTSRPRTPQRLTYRRPPGRGNDNAPHERTHRRQPSIDKSISSELVVYCDACSEKHPTATERC